MFILSLLFLTLLVLLIFSLTKDTGKHTIHARSSMARTGHPAQRQISESANVSTAKIAKAS